MVVAPQFIEPMLIRMASNSKKLKTYACYAKHPRTGEVIDSKTIEARSLNEARKIMEKYVDTNYVRIVCELVEG